MDKNSTKKWKKYQNVKKVLKTSKVIETLKCKKKSQKCQIELIIEKKKIQKVSKIKCTRQVP